MGHGDSKKRPKGRLGLKGGSGNKKEQKKIGNNFLAYCPLIMLIIPLL